MTSPHNPDRPPDTHAPSFHSVPVPQVGDRDDGGNEARRVASGAGGNEEAA